MTAGQTNILLVDDRSENLLALEAILEPLGQNLVSVTSGEAALRELLVRDFAVILLDVQMPELDGFETAALIKQRERTRHIPIIFVTAISMEESHVFRGYSAGAVDYIFKPINPDILRSKVAAFVELHRKTEQLRRQEEQLRERELAELRRAEQRRYRELAEAMPQIVWVADPTGRALYYNRRWFEYTGLDPDGADSHDWKRVVHPADLPEAVERRRESLRTGETFEAQYRFRAGDGTYRWHLGRAVPFRAEDGRIDHWIGTATDIEDQKRTEEAQRFLVEASNVLGSSLDYRSTLASLTRLAVPHIADWCRVDMLEPDGEVRMLAVAHVDPKKVQLAHELQARYPTRSDDPVGGPRVIATGEAQLVPEITDEMLAANTVDELQLALIRELGLYSYMCVPMTTRSGVIGAITFIASIRRFGASDLALAEELARRAATAVENARLYRQAEERAQSARVLASVGDGVFLVDGEGTVRLWNPAAEAITGLAESEVVGRPAAGAIPGWAGLSAHVPVASGLGRAGARAESLPLEVGGRELWLSISGVEIDDGIVYAFRDLTDERALEKMRTDFVATVSHELRTPLAAIYGAALTLRREDVELGDELSANLLRIVAEESDRLARIVNDLLLASNLDSGALEPAIQTCDGVSIAESVVESARTHLPDAIALELRAGDDLPAVEADPEQLRQVLTNLVENAVKYSPEGGAVVVGAERNGHRVRFSVNDEGLGIPAGERERIFEKFYRLDPEMARGIGGSGLGLYICRELVRRVGGKIWVEPRDGGGSSFHVEIPAAAERARPRRRLRAKVSR